MESTSENLDALNETGSRGSEDRRQGDTEVSSERRKVQRRRLIDPTTCERDYTNDEIEFMQAMDEYKRKSGRMFPTCSEILEVLRGMGYVRLENPQLEEETEEIHAETTDENEGDSNTVSAIRTSDMIADDFDQMDDMEESFEDDELDHEFDDE